MTLKNAVTKGAKAWRDRRVGYWLCIDPKTGENGVFVGGEYRRIVVRVHKATESVEVYFGMERRGSLRSRIRILPPRDPPGDGGRREGGGQVFTGTQLHTL